MKIHKKVLKWFISFFLSALISFTICSLLLMKPISFKSSNVGSYYDRTNRYKSTNAPVSTYRYDTVQLDENYPNIEAKGPVDPFPSGPKNGSARRQSK